MLSFVENAQDEQTFLNAERGTHQDSQVVESGNATRRRRAIAATEKIDTNEDANHGEEERNKAQEKRERHGQDVKVQIEPPAQIFDATPRGNTFCIRARTTEVLARPHSVETRR